MRKEPQGWGPAAPESRGHAHGAPPLLQAPLPLAAPCTCQRCSQVLFPELGMLFPENPEGFTPTQSPTLAWEAPGVLNQCFTPWEALGALRPSAQLCRVCDSRAACCGYPTGSRARASFGHRSAPNVPGPKQTR